MKLCETVSLLSTVARFTQAQAILGLGFTMPFSTGFVFRFSMNYLPVLAFSLPDGSVFEHQHHFVGQAGVVGLQLDVLPLYPSGVL